MNELAAKIEAILFAETKGLSFHVLARHAEASLEHVREAVEMLREARNLPESGIHILINNEHVELVTNPAFAGIVGALLKEEMSGELTRPQLETLTIIAYRGPLTRLEIEQIRGVNCQIILRNLQMRGLVEESDGDLVPVYQVTETFLKTLGVTSIDALPDYEAFRKDERITSLLSQPQA